MLGKLLSIFTLIVSFTMIISCASEDEYSPASISSEADFIEVYQNASVDINVLENDSNLPTKGSLSVNDSSNASISIIDNNTPDDPRDDIIRYTPNGIFVGDETLNYSICDESGTNCGTATITIKVLPVSPVAFDLDAMPYPKLSDYNFYEGNLADLTPVYGVLPYEPINPLFSDYAHKQRFIWMPSGVKAKFQDDSEPLDFPEGTILVKNFFYDNVLPNNSTRLIETRVMIKIGEDWTFASYTWNEEQNEAFFDLNGSFTNVQWIQDGVTKEVNYRIPSEPECFTCHKYFTQSTSIGLRPQNINNQYLYDEGSMNQLDKLIEFGYLEDNKPSEIETVGDWTDESLSLKERVRSYVDINCAHCHSEWGHCDYRPLRLAYFQSDNDTNLGVCADADTSIFGLDTLVMPQQTENSILFYRITSIEEQYRMPLLGRTINHDEGIELIEAWINSLNDCN